MDEPLPRIVASAGSPDFDRTTEIMSQMLGAAAMDQMRDGIEPAHHTALTMAAAGYLAGYLAGASIVAGIAHDSDKRRMGEMLLTNFRQGVKIGKDNALLSLAEQEGTGRA